MYPQHNYSAANVTERTKMLGSGARGRGGGTWLPRIRNKQWNMHDNNKKHFSNTILLKQNYWDQQCLSCYQYSVLTRNFVWLLSCQNSTDSCDFHLNLHHSLLPVGFSVVGCCFFFFFCFFWGGGGELHACVVFCLKNKQINLGGRGKLHVFTINTWKTEHFCFF